MSTIADQKWLAPLIARAKNNKKMRLAFVGAAAALPLESAFDAYQQGLIDPILIGDRKKIFEYAAALKWQPENDSIIDAQSEQDNVRIMGELIEKQQIDGIIKGQIHTDIFISGLLAKKREIFREKRIVHIFAIWMPGKLQPLLVSDAAINVSPNINTQKFSLKMMQELAQLLEIDRLHIAILSATENRIASLPSSITAGKLADWAQENIQNCDVSGPLSFDLAYSKKAAEIKNLAQDSVAGRANSFLVPDLVSGNILYKSMVYLGGGCAAGIVMGTKIPVLLTSRADPPAARIAAIAIAKLTAQINI